MIRGTVRALSGIRMAIHMKAGSRMAKLMAMEFIDGPTERSTMASGIEDSNMVMDFGREYELIRMLANGSSRKHMATGCMCGPTAIDTKANGKWA